MKTIVLISTTLCLFFGCSGKTAKVNAQENLSVTYEQYYNDRFGFFVDYPDFLIPQGESGSEDGQIFVSADGESELRVYCQFRLLEPDYSRQPTLREAYEEDLRDVKGITEKKIDDHSYFFAGKDPQDNRCFRRYTMLLEDHFFVIHLLYSEAEAESFQTIADHVHESFALESEDYDEDGFLEVGFNFLNECFYGKNFNTLLRDNDERLRSYIDPKMDIRRFYAPGATCRIASRAEGFAFGEYDDFETRPEVGGENFIHSMKEDDSPCTLVFKEEDVAFCQTIKQLPKVVVNAETFETRTVETPYPNAEMKALYVPNKYGSPIGFYFIKTPDGWKLAFVDDSLCSA